MIRKAILLFHTVKYLKFKQVFFRAYYRIKKIKSSVGYLEKENQGLEQQDIEHFFNQYVDEISAEEVVKEIDGNVRF